VSSLLSEFSMLSQTQLVQGLVGVGVGERILVSWRFSYRIRHGAGNGVVRRMVIRESESEPCDNKQIPFH